MLLADGFYPQRLTKEERKQSVDNIENIYNARFIRQLDEGEMQRKKKLIKSVRLNVSGCFLTYFFLDFPQARKNELAVEDMDGGTFTISNGGVFGSMFGTPIINPPQSAILGMHGIFDRPVAIAGKVRCEHFIS